MPRRNIPSSRMYQATLPVALHNALRREAERMAAESGGQVNINRVLVQRLYETLKDGMTEKDRKTVEAFIANL